MANKADRLLASASRCSKIFVSVACRYWTFLKCFSEGDFKQNKQTATSAFFFQDKCRWWSTETQFKAAPFFAFLGTATKADDV